MNVKISVFFIYVEAINKRKALYSFYIVCMTVPLMSIVDLDLKINYYTKIYFLRFLNKY